MCLLLGSLDLEEQLDDDEAKVLSGSDYRISISSSGEMDPRPEPRCPGLLLALANFPT